jgi:hypothetical protein
MADKEDNPPPADIKIEARRVVAEIIVILESVAAGLEAVKRQAAAKPIEGQLDLLRGLLTRAAETVEAFGELLEVQA